MLSRLHTVDTETRQVENDVIAAGSAWLPQLTLFHIWHSPCAPTVWEHGMPPDAVRLGPPLLPRSWRCLAHLIALPRSRPNFSRPPRPSAHLITSVKPFCISRCYVSLSSNIHLFFQYLFHAYYLWSVEWNSEELCQGFYRVFICLHTGLQMEKWMSKELRWGLIGSEAGDGRRMVGRPSGRWSISRMWILCSRRRPREEGNE